MKPLTNKQLDLVRLVCEGMPLGVAAQTTGIPQRTAVRIMNRDDVKAKQMEYAENVLRMSAGKAATRICEQLDSSNPWIVANAAGRLLQYLQTIDKSTQTAVVVNFGNMPTPGMPVQTLDVGGEVR